MTSAATAPAAVGMDKLVAFVLRAVDEVGTTLNSALVLKGHKLGLFLQDVSLALGAQAGEKRIGDVVTGGGFTHFRWATETPFNLVFEARR